MQADAYVAALDVPGAQRLLPSAWRSMQVRARRPGAALRSRPAAARCTGAARHRPAHRRQHPHGLPFTRTCLPFSRPLAQTFDNIYKLVGVPVITVQLRYNGWVTEMQEKDKVGVCGGWGGGGGLLWWGCAAGAVLGLCWGCAAEGWG